MLRCSLPFRRVPSPRIAAGISWRHRYKETPKSKPKQKPPQPSHIPKLSHLSEITATLCSSQGNKQDPWTGTGFGHTGMQGHAAHHSLQSSQDVIIRICSRSPWCRLGALPVLAHQLFAFSASAARYHIYLCRCSLHRQKAEEQVQQRNPWLPAAALPWRAAVRVDGDWWLCTPWLDLLRAPHAV